MKLGIAGHLTRSFIQSPLTPLFLLAAFAVGIVALITLPREEEPQISVPMVDIMVRADGLNAEDAVKLVTEPLETIIKSIDSVEHVYSQTRDDSVMVTARFLVGTDPDAAILRVHEKIRANIDRIPRGIPEPLIVGRGIDDVAIVVLTLSPRPEAASHWTANGVSRVARELQVELAKLDDIGLTYITGNQPEEIRIEPDPERLSLYGITLQQLSAKIAGANRSFQAGEVRDGGKQISLMGGQTLQSPSDIANILLSARDGRPVYVRDVATVLLSADSREVRSANILRAADGNRDGACRVARTGQAARHQRGRHLGTHYRTSGATQGQHRSGRCCRRSHPQLWRDGQRESQRASVPPGPCHHLHRHPRRCRHRPARGAGGGHRHSLHHPAHALRGPRDGLHAESRVALRAHLLHRYSCR